MDSNIPVTEERMAEGETLSALVARRGALPAAEAIDIFHGICAALTTSHDRQLAHGELSPEKILVAPTADGSFTVTLPVSTLKQADEAFDRAATRVGSEDEKPVSLPQPMWMGPEQLKSRAAIGPFTDVWTLGLMLFHMLSGHSYWSQTVEGDDANSSTLLDEVLSAPLIPASLRAAELGVILPISFDAWFSRCVVRDPLARFADVREAHAGVGPALAPEAETYAAVVAPKLTPVPPGFYAATPPARRSSSIAPADSAARVKQTWAAAAFGGVALICLTALVIAFASGKKQSASASTSDTAEDAPRPKSSADPAALLADNDWLTGSDWVTDPKVDPRTRTLLVKVTPPPKLVETFRTVSARLESARLKGLFGGFALGGSGSGFVLVKKHEPDPMVFVVTNRHVISESEEVEISLDDGTKVAGEVVYADDRHDVAIIGFTGKNPPVTTGLKLAKTPVVDLDSVVATGYPFLAGKPSFQISKGEVRNHAFERNFDDELKETYIQHSASIDPGSSGGPLLNAKNEVVGVNTGFLPEKHDVFLALQASVVNDAINKAVEIKERRANPEWRKVGIMKACKELAAELASPKPRFRVFLQFISNRFVASDGFSTFLSESQDLWTGERLASVFESDPMDGMRDALLARVYSAVSDAGGVAPNPCGDLNPTDAADIVNTSVIRMAFNLKDSQSEIGWTFEHGHWRVASAPLEAPKHRK